MQKTIFLFTFFICISAFSQTKDFVIQWNGTRTLSTETYNVEVPFFNKENFNFSISHGLTFFSEWKVDDYIDENSVKIVNVNYENISREDLKGVKLYTIPNKIQFSFKNAISRDKHSVVL